MRYDVVFPSDGDPADLVAITSGRASIGEILRFRELLSVEHRLAPGSRVLVDHSALDPADFDATAARLLGEGMGAFQRGYDPAVVVALVSENPAVYGCLRMMMTYAELSAEEGGEGLDRTSIRIFPVRADAEAWLRSLAPAPGPRDDPSPPGGAA